MSRRWVFFLAGALLVLGGYWGFLGRSERSGEGGGANHPTKGPASEFAVPDSGPEGTWEAEPLERLRLPAASGSEARKRDGTLFEEEELEEVVYQALYAGDPEDRAFAVGELSTWEPTPQILAVCFEALNDAQEDVRLEAAFTLEVLEDPSAIPVLQRVAEEDPSEEVREAAAEALESLRNP